MEGFDGFVHCLARSLLAFPMPLSSRGSLEHSRCYRAWDDKHSLPSPPSFVLKLVGSNADNTDLSVDQVKLMAICSIFLNKNLFVRTWGWKGPKIWEHSKNIPEAEEVLQRIMEIICFSVNVRQCSIVDSVVYVQLWFSITDSFPCTDKILIHFFLKKPL